MASAPFMIERSLNYHGIWNSGYSVGELFFRNVSQEFWRKPAFPALLKLSTASLSLTVFRRGTATPEAIRTDALPFEAVREVAVNAFHGRCLMVVYVNDKHKFSVIVCSCRDAKQAADIATAFGHLRRFVLEGKSGSGKSQSNWIIRKTKDKEAVDGGRSNFVNNNKDSDQTDGQKVQDTAGLTNGHSNSQTDDVSSVKSRTDSRLLSEDFAFLDNEHDISFEEDSAFEETSFEREVTGENSVSVGVQTNLLSRSDRMSVRSNCSFMSLQSVRDEVDAMPEQSAISLDEYWKMPTVNGHGSSSSNTAEVDETAVDKVDASVGNVDGAVDNVDVAVDNVAIKMNGSKDTQDNKDGATEDDCPTPYDRRNTGTQTQSGPPLTRTRYTKRTGSTHSTNVYKQLAAQRKQNRLQNLESSTGSDVNGGSVRDLPATGTPNHAFFRPASFHGTSSHRGPRTGHSDPIYAPRTVDIARTTAHKPIARTTVHKPIEEVYHCRTWGRRSVAAAPRSRYQALVASRGRNTLRL